MEKTIWLQSTPEQKVILITLLTMANHKEKQWEWKGEKFEAKPGQFVTSLDRLVKRCGVGIKIQNVRTALVRFEKLEFLTNESTKTGRLITIVNWQVYQANDDTPNIDTNKDLTKSQQRPNKDLTPNKNDKNVKNDKKNNYSEFVKLTIAEYERLVNEFNEDAVSRMIEILNNYKGSKGKKYDSDNLAIRSWVIKRYQEEQSQTKLFADKPKTVMDKAKEAAERYAIRHGITTSNSNERSISVIEERH